MEELNKIVEDVFGLIEAVYPIHGRILARHRTALGISRQDFAELCGWSIGFQQGIEEPCTEMRYLSFSERDKIIAVIQIAYEKKLERDNANPS